MSNNTPNWMDKWKRSPRQDRRVLIDGKFVEQGPVQYPEPPQEEQPESTLEVVHEEIVPNSDTIVPETGTEETDVDKAFEFLEIPPVPTEAWQFIKSAQNAGNLISGSVETPAILPAVGEDTAGEGVLDGQVGRVEQVEETQEPL